MDQPDRVPSPGAGIRTHRLDRLRAAARRSSLFVAGVAAAFVALGLYGIVAPGTPPLTASDVTTGVQRALASMTPAPARSQLVYDAIRPSLVLVQVDRKAPGGPAGTGAPAGTAAPSSAPGPASTPRSGASGAPAPDTGGLGSGVVVDQQGDILTSLHVVDGATTIEVTFADGTKSTAHVGNTDPANDIAVIAADNPPATIVPATLGNPRAVQIGSDAYVVGNPFGLYGSISAGVVSGLDRTLQIRDGGKVLHGLIQVDAAVNPGNSGGPLLNRDGQVVGIVAALLNPTPEDVFVGVGLAVPINVAGGPAGLPPY